MKHRLFLALEIPPETSIRIASLQSRLERLQLPIRWEPAEKLHLTTNFIGRADDATAARIRGSVSDVTGRHAAFSLTPVFLETMYRKHEGSYVYLGLAGDTQALKDLQRDLAEVISSLKIPQPDRFDPHITVGKLQKMDPVMTKQVLQHVREVDFDPLPGFSVCQLILYESLLSRAGSHYRKIGRFMLQ